jgi:hypothetical protein
MNYDKVPELPEVPVKPVHRRGGVWLTAGLGLLAVGLLAWWQLGRTPAPPSMQQIQRTEQIVTLEEQVETLHSRLLNLPDNTGPAARRALLEAAIARQNELLRLRLPPAAADTQRLSDWQAQLDDTLAGEWNEQSRELERSAGELHRQKQTAAAVEKLKEALRLQREINRSMAARNLKSYGREAQLQQRIEELAADPLLAEGRRVLGEARAAAAGGSWTDALRLYARAREIQQQLNTDFPRSRFSDLLADGRLETEMASLSAGEALAQRDTFLQQAGAAAAAGKLDEADRFYGLAADRQQVINTQFAQSRFVSMEQLELIETERQTLRMRPLLEVVRGLDRTAAGHLRRRELFQAQQQIAAALAQLEAAVRLLPKARGGDEELRERLNFLGRRAGDLVAMQDQTYDLLLPWPGRSTAAILKVELPQALFALVMNHNPSRTAGRTLPVDSVSHGEAGEFCRRLGWVLGAPVRLPAADELRAMARHPEFKDGIGGRDLWLAAVSGDSTAAPLYSRDGVVKNVPRTERSRTTGLRVVIEVDLLAPR